MSEVDTSARAERAAALKERIYVTFAVLAVVIALDSHGHVAPLEAIVTTVVTALGMLMAIFTADLISHLMVHDRFWSGRELRHAAASTFGSLGALVLPLILLLLALFGVWDTHVGLQASSFALLAALVVYGWLAIRRLPLQWWQRAIVLCAEALLGLVVIVLQILAHS
ncbi:hypothetical protein [Microbacterium sp. CJ88]|uniref:hypothetical protein n=1 Tax=Microbacterium sp. CJ88 TaxID=3445672 RepID=UPI003F65873D